MSKQPSFKPEEHFRNLKGQQYLEVKWRVVWFREEHPEGYITTELVEHDPDNGQAVFRAQAGFPSADGRDVYATGYGSETRKDFVDYLEKSETKAVGRALAMLGYGTAQAMELDEGERAVVDGPVERRGAAEKAAAHQTNASAARRQSTGPARLAETGRTPLAVVPAPVDLEELRAQVESGLAADAEAAAKLPKRPQEMDQGELTKTLAWLTRRARALSS
jgi:hypothetical protein